MKRPTIGTVVALALGAIIAPGVAYAAITELGSTKTAPVAPVCPPVAVDPNCSIILTQTTALETIRDGLIYPTTVKKEGYLVAFTVGLSQLSTNKTTVKNDIKKLDKLYGGVPEAAITVLKPVKKKGVAHAWAVVYESPPSHLIPYLGQVVQFPLQSALHVVPGEAIALTVPTWAPVLTEALDKTKFAYRQSRSGTTKQCNSPAPTQTAQLTPGQTAQYLCDYTGTRVEYSATEVTTPTPTAGYVH
jgi:hypothetical protein